MFSAMGVGGIVGSLWMANRNRLQGTTAIFLGGMALVTVLTVVFATANSFVLAAIYMSFLGLVTTVTMNGAQILIQSSVDGAVRARVMSLYSLNFRAGPSIGAMLIGGLSSFFGLQITVAGSAILCLLAVLVILPRWRRIAAALESPPDAAVAPQVPTT